MKHKEDCTFNDYHRSLWHRLNEWEYELVIDCSGIFYGVKRYIGINDIHPERHKSEFIDFKFCPMCGVELGEGDTDGNE